MADSIIVKVSDIRACIQEARRDGMDYVKISISDPDEFDGEILPACIDIAGCKLRNTGMWVDYDPVEAIPDNEKLLNDSTFGVHMSPGLI